LVVDFDTTVNSSPTDISGQGNHGAFYGGASYSAADKAFILDGSDDYIDVPTVSGVGTGAWVHSKSFWFKLKAVEDGILFLLGSNSSTRQIAVQRTAAGQFQYYIYGCNSRVQVNGVDWVPDLNRWYHCVTVFKNNETTAGGSQLTGREMYIDGVKQTLVAINTQVSLDLNTTGVRFGNQYNTVYQNYQLSNPKLYSVALEASEVQKLYRLGRTGRSMVISDTAVGIGKVPEAQLDVRGSGGFTGDLTVGGNMNNYQYWFRGNRNGQNTNGATTGSLLVIQYESIAGSYTSAWTGSNAYNCPVAGVYMVHGGLMCFSNAGEAGYMWIEVRRYNSAGAQLDVGSANDMHTPYRDNTYQSYHFQQTHLCNKGDRLQIFLRGSNTDAHLDLHSNWGPLNIYKIG
jgi:hypothetical protein